MSRPIADVLRDLQRGQFYEEVSDALADLVSSVQAARKSGSLTIKLTVAPNGDATVKIGAEYKATPPKEPRGESIFFVSGTGTLTRNDPRQTEIPFPREVQPAGEAPAEPRKVRGYDE